MARPALDDLVWTNGQADSIHLYVLLHRWRSSTVRYVWGKTEKWLVDLQTALVGEYEVYDDPSTLSSPWPGVQWALYDVVKDICLRSANKPLPSDVQRAIEIAISVDDASTYALLSAAGLRVQRDILGSWMARGDGKRTGRDNESVGWARGERGVGDVLRGLK